MGGASLDDLEFEAILASAVKSICHLVPAGLDTSYASQSQQRNPHPHRHRLGPRRLRVKQRNRRPAARCA